MASPSRRNAFLLFGTVFTFALILKCSTLWKPFLGYFASYQTVSAMVAATFARENFAHLLLPQAFYLIQGEPAVILLFYPLDALLAALGHKFLGGTVDFWGRLNAVIFSTASLPLLYQIVRKATGDSLEALGTTAIFLLFPLGLIVGQGFFNDNLALFLFLAGYLLLLQKERSSSFRKILGCLLCSLSFILRIHFIFLFPLALWTLMTRDSWKIDFRGAGYAFLLLLLPALWLIYVYGEAPQHAGLHTSFFVQVTEGRRYQMTREFLEHFPRALWGVILSPFGFVLTVLGAAGCIRQKEARIFYVWLFCSALIPWVIPQKALDHPFYLLPLLPPAAFFVARTYRWVLSSLNRPKWAFLILACFHVGASLQYSAGPLHSDLPRAPLIQEVAGKVKGLSRPEDLLIVSDSLDFAILYYADRRGWAFYEPAKGRPVKKTEEIIRQFEEKLKIRPARYYVMGSRAVFEDQNPEFLRYLGERFPIIFEKQGVLIFDLRP